MILSIRPFFFQLIVPSASASSNSSKMICFTRSSSRCLLGGRWSRSVFIAGGTLSARRLLGKVEAASPPPELPPPAVLSVDRLGDDTQTADHRFLDLGNADAMALGKLAIA